MPNSQPPQIVVDASTVIAALLPTLAPVDTLDLFTAWRRTDTAILAPPLLLAECTSAIRRYVHSGLLADEEAATALADLAALDVEIVPDTHARCRAAYVWAGRLGQARAYDGFYCALAEEVAARLYSGDRWLANTGRQLGVDWIIWVGEPGILSPAAQSRQQIG
ncbi:MAG: type II toxin-antitoxin system VapC family toxin [Caldilinea sp.]|nr:type II toxin-antitoxin system VapC family toxin [Caldilinea sp.]